MLGEIITIGDELLIGQVVNTNQAFIAAQLNTAGVYVHRMVTVGDDAEAIAAAMREAAQRADIVCVTGGLGPTHDDITKKVVCRFFGTDLVEDPETRSNIERLAVRRGISVTAILADQALVPRGCTVIPNTLGTAPGMLLEHREGARHVLFFVMPGVPFEMEAMIGQWIVPYLRRISAGPVILHRTLRTTGIGESLLAKQIGDLGDILGNDNAMTLAFLPSPTGTRLRLTIRHADRSAAEERLRNAEALIRSRAGRYIYGVENEEIEDVLGNLFRERGLTLATAESCTGGYIAHRITNVPGSSDYFLRGYVTYSNDAKTELLGVSPGLIEREGAVSGAVAEAMARGARSASGASVAVSTTGIAGPGGGTADKPVGLVFIGYADGETSLALKFNFGDSRLRFKERASQAALELLRKKLLRIDLTT